jgi:CheY-like chemotaxis protein
MDIGLPIMTGTEACIGIRAHETQNHLKPVPIVAITANNSTEEFQSYITAGMQHALEKPRL